MGDDLHDSFSMRLAILIKSLKNDDLRHMQEVALVEMYGEIGVEPFYL